MKTRKINPTATRRLGRLLTALAVVALGTSSASAQLGKPGDVYVIGEADTLGLGFESPVVMQYDSVTGQRVGNFVALRGGQFNGMTWGPNGNLFTTHMLGFGRWNISEFDGTTGQRLSRVIEYNVGDFSVAKGITFGPGGDLYVGDWGKGNVRRYDGTTYALKATTNPRGIGTPNGMRFSPNGNLLVVGGGFNEIREYDVSNNSIADLGAFTTGLGGIQPQDLTFGPNGNIFVTLGGQGGVVEVDSLTGNIIGNFIATNTALPNNGLAFDNNGRLLVSEIFPISRVDSYDAATGAFLGNFIAQGLGGMGVPTLISIKPIPAPASLSLLFAASVVGTRRRRQ